jgi:E3 ubiquitin-protein ligase UBR4
MCLTCTDHTCVSPCVQRLSTATVPFTVISVAHNPCHEDFMVVCGLKECQLLVLNSSAQVTSRAVLHPSVDQDGYIVKAMWVPGSQTELVVVSDAFVKIYDLRVDLISPVYYFVVLTGKIKDATVAVTGEEKFVVVMSSTGVMYSQPVIPACNAVEGPVYFTIDLAVTYPSGSVAGATSPQGEDEGEESVFGGGVSIYYSHTLKMLFFSFMNGKSFMGSPNSTMTEVRLVVTVPLKANGGSSTNSSSGGGGGKGSGPALVQWTEVQHHPGLVCAVCQNSNNPVVLLVKPEQIQVHELKPLPNKAKVQGMVAMRQPPSSDNTAHHRTTLIILCEDGSLRIYVANNNTNTEFWMQPQFKPTSPLVLLKGRGKRGPRGGGRHSDKPKFPVDFFEHCQALPFNDIEFGGPDVLRVYNKQQLKHRLNLNNLYVVSTRSSGFTVEVTSNMSGQVTMVGVRVMVGLKSLEKAPSFVEIFGRTHPVSFPANCHRWVDIPFTREEALQADKLIKINCEPRTV